MFEKSQAELIEIIQQSKLFSKMDHKICEDLSSRFEKVIVSQGEILFSEGEPSDSLYILIEGHLVAMLTTHDGKQKIIGIIGLF